MSPVSPYQEPIPHSSGSGLNAPGGCLSNPTTSAMSALPADSIAWAVVSAEPPVAQPFLTLMNGTPVSPTHGHHRVGVARGVRAAGGEVDLLPSDTGIREGGANRMGAHLEAGDAGMAPEGMDPQPDDRDVLGHRSSTGRNANVMTSARPGAGISVSSIAIPIRSRAGSDSVSLASTRTSPGNST